MVRINLACGFLGRASLRCQKASDMFVLGSRVYVMFV